MSYVFWDLSVGGFGTWGSRTDACADIDTSVGRSPSTATGDSSCSRSLCASSSPHKPRTVAGSLEGSQSPSGPSIFRVADKRPPSTSSFPEVPQATQF